MDALDTVEGAALASEIVDNLEAELVRFRHRVMHDHGIEVDRARAAMVVLGKLVGAGVPWIARPDSDPARIHEAFSTIVMRDEKLAPVLKREIAAFFAATADVKVEPEDTSTASSAMLRRAGADPSLWWWAAGHADRAQSWLACGSDVDKLIQVALAFGVTTDHVARALAGALVLIANRVKSRLVAQKTDLVTNLTRISSNCTRALADEALVGAITKLAFEMTAATQMREKKLQDPIADVALRAFELVAAVKAAKQQPDLERFAMLGVRADKMFSKAGMQLAGMLRKELDEVVGAAIKRPA